MVRDHTVETPLTGPCATAQGSAAGWPPSTGWPILAAVIHSLLADLVVGLHLAFVLFVVFGGLLALRRRRVAWLHLPAVVWGALIEWRGWICPLTPLEVSLRRRAGEAGYQEGFLDHYVIPLLYPPGLTRELQLAMAAGVLALNAVVYGIVLWRRRQPRIRREDC